MAGIAKAPSRFQQFFSRLQKIKLTQKIFFVQQLGVMVRTGISLSVGLKTLSEQTDNKYFKKILVDLQQGVEQGNLLSAGLEKYRHTFGDMFINMIRAGETSGKLEDVMRQLFMQMKKDHEIVSKVRGAMIYPSVVVTLMIAIGILVMVYVIPNITGIFEELNVELPLFTRILIGLSHVLVNYGLYIGLAAILLFVGLQRLISLPKGKMAFHKLVLKIPIMGKIIRKINIARFCRTLSSLLKTDIPIVKSFEITSRILGNVVYRSALMDAKEKIKKGVSIEESLRQYQTLFPPVVLQMISVGEDTGTLDTILEESATFYEDDVNQTMTDLPSLIEPILLVVIGVGVGAMAVAVIMPLYSLSEQI
jgi:type IV pilus assembly protein PilC